ncbi:PNLIP [Branchiostoma lanceolatum]|uniref:PNLIP protein n=2 Tax=Branchiostoma lanceolatum TaxID=7740 RepID=A0A8K0F232_BRALA|nr:PNLIP [Branchiostoma lanceolatum]
MSQVVLFTWCALTVLSSSQARGETVCYPELDCFSTGGGFVDRLPAEPVTINTHFLLFTRNSLYGEQFLRHNAPAGLLDSHFNSSKDTKFLVHGYMDDRTEEWLVMTTDAILARDDVNVVIVDWGGGAMELDYSQVAANARVVGAELARFISFLKEEVDVSGRSIHIIGHSLGAHIAGYAGQRLATTGSKIGRITALDPAEPGFQGTPPHVRLDPSDAMFVDAIHTDGEGEMDLGFGMSQPVGHLDFYPNGGRDQPGCSDNLLNSIWDHGLFHGGKDFVTCNHKRAHRLFVESIRSTCPWRGYPCAGREEFQRGDCLTCGATGCYKMGYDAVEKTPPSGTELVKLYLTTEGQSPYCHRHEYRVEIILSNNGIRRRFINNLSIRLRGSRGVSPELKLISGSEPLSREGRYVRVVGTPQDPGFLHSVDLRWENDRMWYVPSSWWGMRTTATLQVDRVLVDTAGAQSVDRDEFCAYGRPLAANQIHTIHIC